MTRKRLGSVDRNTISIMRNVAEQSAAERRAQAAIKAPPIGQVASNAAQNIEEELLRLRREADGLRMDAASYQAAHEAGLILVEIPLDRIDDHALARDRRHLEKSGEAWTELVDSLRARGQQTPIEVADFEVETERYPLVSGYRRLSALRRLYDETGDDRFATVQALVRSREDLADAMIAMVEENEIRQDISFYERGRICCIAVDRGVFPTVDDAILALFGNSSRNRRYKIRNFTVIHQLMGAHLDFPEQIGERLGARLAQAIKDGRGAELASVLGERSKKFASADDELAMLEAFVARKGMFAPDSRENEPAAVRAQWQGDGVRATARASRNRISVEFVGLTINQAHELQALLERITGAIDDV